MLPYVVLSRVLPTYEFVAAVPMTPADARASVERTLPRAANLPMTLFIASRVACLRATPLFWRPIPSIVIRFVPSVVGTNLHVRLSIGRFWWAILGAGTLSSISMPDGLAVAAGAIVFAVVVLLLYGIVRTEESVLASLSG